MLHTIVIMCCIDQVFLMLSFQVLVAVISFSGIILFYVTTRKIVFQTPDYFFMATLYTDEFVCKGKTTL